MPARAAAALFLVLMGSAAAPAADDRYPNLPNGQSQGTQDEQAACMPDAMKLCDKDIPNASAVLACLQAHRATISKECRDVLRSNRK